MVDYDIIIAGGGMVGTTLGLALSPLPLRIAVVEAVAREGTSQPSFDDRSTALSRSSRRAFEAMGLWSSIVAESTPITSIHVSEAGRFGFAHIDAVEQGVEALGHVVINRALGGVLQRAAAEAERLRVHCPARITAVRMSAANVCVRIEDGGGAREYTSRLLVAADGADSFVRGALGIRASRRDYGQCAITGNLLPEIAPGNRAFERFRPEGPLALLPVAGNRAAFVWTLPPDRAEEVMRLRDDAFCASLRAAFGNRLGRFEKVGARKRYPLALTRAERLTAQRSALVGSAAVCLHPVAAQGFNLGLRDVAALCDCIADAARSGGAEAVGAREMLLRYAAWRRADHLKVSILTDGLVRLFGNPGPIRLLRAAGLLGFDTVPGVRRLFARHMMGLAGRLPRLSRGMPLA